MNLFGDEEPQKKIRKVRSKNASVIVSDKIISKIDPNRMIGLISENDKDRVPIDQSSKDLKEVSDKDILIPLINYIED